MDLTMTEIQTLKPKQKSFLKKLTGSCGRRRRCCCRRGRGWSKSQSLIIQKC